MEDVPRGRASSVPSLPSAVLRGPFSRTESCPSPAVCVVFGFYLDTTLVAGHSMPLAVKTWSEDACLCGENERFLTRKERQGPSIPGPSSGDRVSGVLVGCGAGMSPALALLLAVAALAAVTLPWRPGLFLSHMLTALLL